MADETNLVAASGPGEAETTEETANLNAMVIDDFAALVYLNTPEAGQTQEVLLAVGDIVRVDFDINNQTLVIDGDDLRIEFENGAVIVLDNFVALADQGVAPLLSMPDGAMIPGEILLTALTETPEETAAGEAASGGGSSAYVDDMGDTLDGIDRLGVQDPDSFGAAAALAPEDEQTPVIENQPPDAVNDPIRVDEDNSVTFNVLDNDSDPDGDPIVVTGHTQPDHGELIDNGDGSFTYTPEPDYNGPDEFEYTIDDGQGGTDTATVEIIVTPEPTITVGDADGVIQNIDVPEGTDAVLNRPSPSATRTASSRTSTFPKAPTRSLPSTSKTPQQEAH
jgi:hypothetical protein